MLLKRRDLLKGTIASLAAGLIPGQALAAQPREMPMRVLGRTGLAVSVLGYGAMQCSDPVAIRHGLDGGINYIDTAGCYMGGRNEKIVGQAISGIRDRLVIATKVHISREERMRSSVDRSLASLGVERVDLMQLHGMSSRSQIIRKDVQQIMQAMKDDGKFRFTAVTTHSNQVEVLKAVMEDGFYDAVLVAVNFRSPPDLFEAIEEAAAAGVGIVAMKTQNGGYRNGSVPEFTPHQAALRFVVEKPGVHIAVPGMLSQKMVNENLAAIMGKGGLTDLLRLDAYRTELEGRACSFCSECINQCRYGTGGLDAVRIAMYSEGYRDQRLAAERAVDAVSAVKNCADCEGCTVDCSQGIDIKAAAKRASLFLT
ncbi:MAG: aldo/keto reductase [bacterium]|nr:aldo/keto reductase [bacterium]MDT8366948.1 aldo/keto reductase [bacterium]